MICYRHIQVHGNIQAHHYIQYCMHTYDVCSNVLVCCHIISSYHISLHTAYVCTQYCMQTYAVSSDIWYDDMISQHTSTWLHTAYVCIIRRPPVPEIQRANSPRQDARGRSRAPPHWSRALHWSRAPGSATELLMIWPCRWLMGVCAGAARCWCGSWGWEGG